MASVKRVYILLGLLMVLPLLLGNTKGCNGPAWEHEPVSRTDSCADCHDDGMSRNTIPPGHDANFIKNHGQIIGQIGLKSKNNCAICHSGESSCNQCHKHNAPQDHTNQFRMQGHGLQAAMNRTKCSTCHEVDFCQRCHATTEPMNHTAGFGTPSNNHCISCHYPVSSIGAQNCFVCHKGTPSHIDTPKVPNNSLHRQGVDCRGCHVPLKHPDNGMNCTACHTK